MGYEIAGGWGAKLADPSRDVIVMVGDGSYLMMNTDIYSSVLTGMKLIVVVCDNGGFAVIDRLQRAKGIPSFNNQLADTRHVGELARVDFAKHAEAMGAIGIRVSGIGELEDAFRRAKAADRTTVIHIDVHPTDWTEGNGAWWECGTPEVSPRESRAEGAGSPYRGEEAAAARGLDVARARERLFTIEDWLAYEGEPDRLLRADRRPTCGDEPAQGLARDDRERDWPASARDALQGRFPCRALQGAGSRSRREPRAKGYVADVVVTCEPFDENRPLVRPSHGWSSRFSPHRLVVTTGSDKLADYQQLPTIEEIWLVFSEARLVLQAVREPGQGWSENKAFIGKASFRSPVLGVTVALDDIYRFTPMAQIAELSGRLRPA